MSKSNGSGRTQRNNPYQLEELFVQFHRPPAGIAWRWRAELLILSTDTWPMATVPTVPFSMFDPVHLGVDEYGEPVYVNLAERNMLVGGEPGGGKSSAEQLIVAHGALSHDCRPVLVDGNQNPGIERLLTLEEAAAVLGTKPRFTRRLVAERRIRFTYVGRFVRIPESALREFIKAGTVEPVTAWAHRRSRKAA